MTIKYTNNSVNDKYSKEFRAHKDSKMSYTSVLNHTFYDHESKFLKNSKSKYLSISQKRGDYTMKTSQNDHHKLSDLVTEQQKNKISPYLGVLIKKSFQDSKISYKYNSV